MADLKRRVGAFLGADDEPCNATVKGRFIRYNGTMRFLGYGTLEKSEVPEKAVGVWAEVARRTKVKSPTILLDSGKKVYGCECYWAGEGVIKKTLDTYSRNRYNIVTVDIDEVRKDFRRKTSNRGRPKGSKDTKKRKPKNVKRNLSKKKTNDSN